MIEKPTIIVTSLGRTGTKFFATFFREIIFDGVALHQPDIISREDGLLKQFQESGLYNLVVLRTLGKWSLIRLSDAKVKGDISRAEATQELLRQRRDFIKAQPGGLYVESSSGYYGLLDVLSETFRHYRAVYLVRDGRSWVRSQMNWGGLYADKGFIKSKLAHTWPTAAEFKADPYRSQWAKMTRFERVCWAWARLNGYALDRLSTNSNVRLFRFEDIFKAEDRYDHLADLVQFTTTFPGLEPIETRPIEGWLEKRIHQSAGQFPDWPNWSAFQKQRFDEICGPLMARLAYPNNRMELDR